jgi:hypothetical protein
MRLANLDHRCPRRRRNGAEKAIDIATPSQGQFVPELPALYRRWNEVTAWAADLDIGTFDYGAHAMFEVNPRRDIWGLGGRCVGANCFWYLKGSAGTFSEYYSDTDTIPEDERCSPEVLHGLQGLYAWGPPPPSFLEPHDLTETMTGADSARAR